MKINIPITLAITCLSISLAFIIITFILENWINVKSTNDKYGMWRACRAIAYTCFNWYDSGETFLNYKLSNFYKAFQGLQACMLGLVVVSLISLFFNLIICAQFITIFIVDSILIFLACACGLSSLIIFGVSVYEVNNHDLDWCYWLSVTDLVLIFLSLIFLIAFIIQKKGQSNDSLKSSLYVKDKKPEKINPETVYVNKNNELERPNESANQNNNSTSKKPNSPKLITNEIESTPSYIGRQTNQNNNNFNGLNSPKYQKNRPTSNTNNTNKENQVLDNKKKLNRYYWNEKKPGDKARYKHRHYKEKKPSQESYRAGYSSEPEMIEYSLERSFLSSSNNNLNNSMPTILDEPEGFTGTFNSRHFVKLPKLIYYDGSNHYSRANYNNKIY